MVFFSSAAALVSDRAMPCPRRTGWCSAAARASAPLSFSSSHHPARGCAPSSPHLPLWVGLPLSPFRVCFRGFPYMVYTCMVIYTCVFCVYLYMIIFIISYLYVYTYIYIIHVVFLFIFPLLFSASFLVSLAIFTSLHVL